MSPLQALVLANSDPATYENFIRLTAGVVFLGTPHRGSATQSLGVLVTKCAMALGFQAETTLLDILHEDSVVLHELVHNFSKIVGRQSIPVKFFFELYETPLGRRVPWPGNIISSGSVNTMVRYNYLTAYDLPVIVNHIID